MLKAVGPGDDTLDKAKFRHRKRRLRTIAMLPTLLTLGNLLFGVAAVCYCGRELQDLGAGRKAMQVLTLNRKTMEALAPSFLSIAAWMVLGGMICDTLDGRVARRTGQSSQFGTQMDSLADVVSFGVAPALMMITMVRRELAGWGGEPFGFPRFGQAAMFIGFIYIACAALRLARFNVETTLEEAAHKGFRGLPSPGAAGALASVIFLHEHLDQTVRLPGLADALTIALPGLTLAMALLMVSPAPYTHAANALLRRRPFWHVVPILFLLALLLLYTEVIFFVTAWSFVLSGPVRYLYGLRKGRPAQPAPADVQANGAEPEVFKRQVP